MSGRASVLIGEDTVPFVDEIFAKYSPKAVLSAPAAPQQSKSQFQSQNAPSAASGQPPFPFGVPQGPSQVPSYVPEGGYGNAQNSRKRTYNEGFQPDNDQTDSQRGGRSFKSPRTRRGGRGDRMGGGRDGDNANPQFPQSMPGFPGMPPAFPGFDQNDPMATMMALQSMGFPQMPGMPPMPAPGQPPGDQAKSNEPCPFYETNGICYMGAACPYRHGENTVVVPSKDNGTRVESSSVGNANLVCGKEYDPTNASIYDVNRSQDPTRKPDRTRGRGRGRGDRGGFSSRARGGRSEFSHIGPNEDKSNTAVVVENIPEEKYSEQVIRDYFSEFGNISEITMQGFKKHLAVIKFDGHDAAHRAWSSPKAIFDNRFVKVYWYKPQNKPETNGSHQTPDKEPDDTPMFDKEEFEKQQAEAQKLHDERMQKRKETEEARLALEKQREELIKKQREEKAKLLERLRGSPAQANGHSEKGAEPAEDDNASEQTKSLRAQLAALEAEAKSLGIDPNAPSFRGRGRGFGGYRGRGSYVPRGRGSDSSFRGGYRGRGAPRGGRGGVLRLDNRPKRVAISGVEFSPEKDEALRQYLIVSVVNSSGLLSIY